MLKKFFVLMLVLMLIIPSTGVLAWDYLPSSTNYALESSQSGMLTGGYWNITNEGYSLEWNATEGYYPDAVWKIYCGQDGLYEIMMNYKAVQGNLLDRVYIDGELLATSTVFNTWMEDFADASLGNFYLTEGIHTIKMTEAENIGGFYVKSITIKDAAEGYPVIGEQDMVRIEAETEVNTAIKIISDNYILKKVVAPKAGKYYIGISWCAYTGSDADIYVNNSLVYADVIPSVVQSAEYEYNHTYLKDFYAVELNEGLNEIKISADAQNWIYVDFIEVVDIMDTTENPDKIVKISAHNCTHWAYCDISHNTRGFTANLNVIEGGAYKLKLRWSGYDGTDTATISVNGESIGSVKPTQYDTTYYNTPQYFKEDTYTVTLKEGDNTIFVKADAGKWVYLDYIELSANKGAAEETLVFDEYIISSSTDSDVTYESLNAAKEANVKDVIMVGKVTNNTSATEKLAVFAASYDAEGKMIDADVEVISELASGSFADIDANLDITNAAKIKVFAVKDILTLIPVGEVSLFE